LKGTLIVNTCVLTGNSTSFGNNVSHSKRQTSRRFDANGAPHRLCGPEVGCYSTVTLSAKGLRSLFKHGGLVPALHSQGKTLQDICIT
jgi:large subunit ribosomal protein L28